jgi:hypothetical protein
MSMLGWSGAVTSSGPVVPLVGRTNGRVCRKHNSVPRAAPFRPRLSAFAGQAKLDLGALQDWADGRALQAAVRTHLVAGTALSRSRSSCESSTQGPPVADASVNCPSRTRVEQRRNGDRRMVSQYRPYQ